MKKLRGFKTIDLQEVVNRLKIELRFIITNAELRSTFTDVLGEPPTVEIAREVRKMLDAERVIPPLLDRAKSRGQAARASFCFGVMPPSAILGRS